MTNGLIWVQCDIKEYRVGMGPYQDFESYREITPAWESAGRCPIRFQSRGMVCDIIDEGRELGHAVPVEGFKCDYMFRRNMVAHWAKITGIKLGKKTKNNN